MTTERIDHAAEALNFLGATTFDTHGDDDRKVALAQVHATLALVEQQRIANLIALSVSQDFGPDGANVRIPSYTNEGVLRDDIAEGLGL